MRLRSVFCACLAGLVGSALLHSGALAFATLAGSAVAVLVVVTRRRLFTCVSFERALSKTVVPWGGDLEVTVSLANDKLLPLVWLRVRDQWPLGLVPSGFVLVPIRLLGRQELVQTISMRWYERVRRRYRVRCLERGVHRFGPVELQAGDPFGIAGVNETLEERRDVTVLPRVLGAPGFEVLLGRPLVEEAAVRSLAVDPTALRGVRPYRPGDPVRAVNWRATARMGELNTNEFDPSSLAAVRLLLDVTSLRRSWEVIEPELLELLCVVAASLTSAFAERGCAVGLASNAAPVGQTEALDLPAAHGGLQDVLLGLARLSPLTVCDFGGVLRQELAAGDDGAGCVVIAARLRPAAQEATAGLRASRPTSVVLVGRRGLDEARDADLVVPGDFDWRAADALNLLA